MKEIRIDRNVVLQVSDHNAAIVFYNMQNIPKYYSYSMPDKYETDRAVALEKMKDDLSKHGNDYVVAVCCVGYLNSIPADDISIYPQWFFPINFMEMLDLIGKFPNLAEEYEKAKKILSFGANANDRERIKRHMLESTVHD